MSLLRKILGIPGATRRVHMIVSVEDLIAGNKYDLVAHEADKLIARGYAEGELSRPFSEDELAALRANQQTVVI